MQNDNYQQLTLEQKKIYRVLLEKLHAYETEILLDCRVQDIGKSYAALLDNHPELFWLSGAYSTTTRGIKNIKFFPKLKPGYTIALAKKRTEELEAVVQRIIIKTKWHLSIFSRILEVHDYIAENTSYVMTAPHRYDAYGCLVEKKAVCAGYSAAFHLLMNRLGIPCGRVYGSSTEENTSKVTHEWNYVKIGSSFYFIDVTWDRYDFAGCEKLHMRKYDYFLIDATELLRTHRIVRNGFVPICKSNYHNYHKQFGFYLKSYDFHKLKAIAEYQLATRRFFTVRFETPQELQKAVTALMKKSAVYNIKGIRKSIQYLTSRSNTVLTVYNVV